MANLVPPSPDEIFHKWVNKIPDGDLEKKFGLKKQEISAAETVKNVDKTTAFYFKAKQIPAGQQPKSKPEKVKPFEIGKIQFYEFERNLTADEWSEKSQTVIMYKDLKKEPCQKCSGKGYEPCKDCNGKGKKECSKCKGKTQDTCNKCKGNKTIEEEVTIIKYPDKKKRKEKVSIQCTYCFGVGTLKCAACGGTGGEGCKKCAGNGKVECKDCKGVGFFFIINESLVPFKASEIDYFFIPNKYESKKLKLQKKKQEMDEILEKAGAAIITDYKELTEKNIEEQFSGFKYDKEGQKKLEEARKTYEDLHKSFEKGKGSVKPLEPIKVYYLMKLNVKTPKGKQFELYSIGAQNNFFVIEEGF